VTIMRRYVIIHAAAASVFKSFGGDVIICIRLCVVLVVVAVHGVLIEPEVGAAME